MCQLLLTQRNFILLRVELQNKNHYFSKQNLLIGSGNECGLCYVGYKLNIRVQLRRT
jgi:hypothetical protein